MESAPPDQKTSSQPNQGTSLSAFMDAVALQEQLFEQSLVSQQLWSQSLVDAQKAKIKVAAYMTTTYATEVNQILTGEKGVALEGGSEEFHSQSGSKEEPELQLPQQSSISKSGSTSLFQYPEVHEEHRMHSPRDFSRSRLGDFNCYTDYDDYKDCHRSGNGENGGDGRLDAWRRSPSLERCWDRRRGSPKSERRYHEDSHSSRFGSFRCQSGKNRGRNHHRRFRSPVDDSIPDHGRPTDSRKHRDMRGASYFETARNNRSRDFLAGDHGDDDMINVYGLDKGTDKIHGNSGASVDTIVKNKEEQDKTSLRSKDFDYRCGNELLPRHESVPRRGKDIGTEHHEKYGNEGSETDGDYVDARKKTRRK